MGSRYTSAKCSLQDRGQQPHLISTFISNNYAIRLSSVPFLYRLYYSRFTEYSYWNTLPMFLIVYCSYFTHFGMFLLSLNRLTAVSRFRDHEQLWRKIKPYMLAFAFAGSFLLSFQELICRQKYEVVLIQNTVFTIIRFEEAFSLWASFDYNHQRDLEI